MKKPSEEGEGEDGPGEDALNLDSIGCTANVIVID